MIVLSINKQRIRKIRILQFEWVIRLDITVNMPAEERGIQVLKYKVLKLWGTRIYCLLCAE